MTRWKMNGKKTSMIEMKTAGLQGMGEIIRVNEYFKKGG